jgi:hypothetical protein
MILPAGKKKFIHVNRGRIDSNRKHGKQDATITVKMGSKNFYGRDVTIIGTTRLTQEECQLSCGARVYIITNDEVRISE